MPRGIYERTPRRPDHVEHPNGHSSWGRITEVTPDEIPPLINRRFKYSALHEELALRLEQTDPPLALKVPFATPKIAKVAHKSILNYFVRSRGAGVVIVRVRGQDVYVSRGPNWK